MKAVVLEDWNSIFDRAPSIEALRRRIEVRVDCSVLHGAREIINRCSGAEIVVLNRERTEFGREVLAELPELRLVVQTSSVGANLDVASASELGVCVSTAPGLGNALDGVAELALGLLLSLVRNLNANDQAARSGRFRVPPTGMLSGKTMGVLGLGRLGARLAGLGHALHMEVIAAGRTRSHSTASEQNVQRVELHELFSRSDVVFVCARLTNETDGLVGRELLQLMKSSAYLINVARGRIVDEDALLEMLEERRIAGAGLDTFGTEPLPDDHRLARLGNVVLTPHIGWVIEENCDRLVALVANRIERYLDGDMSRVINVGPGGGKGVE